jgi:hypothetical protein
LTLGHNPLLYSMDNLQSLLNLHNLEVLEINADEAISEIIIRELPKLKELDGLDVNIE